MKLFDTVKSALLDGITELDAPCACDLHYHLYNLPDHFIYHANAKAATAELDVWDCIRTVEKYEQARFGAVSTPLSDPCKVANMLVYIMGEELLNRIYGPLPAHRLSSEELEEMHGIASRWFEENIYGLLDIWKDL